MNQEFLEELKWKGVKNLETWLLDAHKSCVNNELYKSEFLKALKIIERMRECLKGFIEMGAWPASEICNDALEDCDQIAGKEK